MEDGTGKALDFTGVNIFSPEFPQMLNQLVSMSGRSIVRTNTLRRKESPDGVLIELPDWVKQIERQGETLRVLNLHSTTIDIGDVVPIDQGHTLSATPTTDQVNNYAGFGMAANKAAWDEGDYFGVALEHSNLGNGYRSILVQVAGVALAKCTIGSVAHRFASIAAGVFASGTTGDYRLVNHLPTSGFAFIDLNPLEEFPFLEITGVTSDGAHKWLYSGLDGAYAANVWVVGATVLTGIKNTFEENNTGGGIEGSGFDFTNWQPLGGSARDIIWNLTDSAGDTLSFTMYAIAEMLPLGVGAITRRYDVDGGIRIDAPNDTEHYHDDTT